MPEFAGHPISTRWFEDVVLPEKVTEAAANGAAAPSSAPTAPAQPAEERATVVVELDGKRMQLTVPRTMLGAGNGSTSRPRGQQPLRGAARARSEATAGDQVDSSGMVNSQIQAIVVRVCVEESVKVKEGDLLVILESMKMESYVYAPYDGTVTDVVVEGGQNVSAYQPLVRVARAEEEN